MNNNDNSKRIRKSNNIFIFDAVDGMVLATDVISPDGQIIAPKNTTLTMDIISRISNLHILEIAIYIDDEDYDEPKKIISSNNSFAKPVQNNEPDDSYYSRIRKTEQFKEFNKEYTKDLSILTDNLNDIILRDKTIDPNEILNSTKNMIETQRNSLELLDMLHSLKETEDSIYTHSINVSLIAAIIGKWLHYSQADIDILTLCGTFHDIGKALIPKEILDKRDFYSASEYDIAKQHVNLGYEKLKKQNIDLRVKEVCLLHHEKCDGSGYPYGLTGTEIPDFVKIITIADVYDAMTNARSYREPLCPFDVIKKLNEQAFSLYDPKFMLPFLRNVADSYIHNNVLLSNGQKGEVILIQEHSLHQPVVKCENSYIDLSKESSIKIVKVI